MFLERLFFSKPGQRASKPGDVGLEAVRGGGWGIVAPDSVDQALVGYDPAGFEQQCGKNGLLLSTAQIERMALDLGFECAEDAKPEGL